MVLDEKSDSLVALKSIKAIGGVRTLESLRETSGSVGTAMEEVGRRSGVLVSDSVHLDYGPYLTLGWEG